MHTASGCEGSIPTGLRVPASEINFVLAIVSFFSFARVHPGALNNGEENADYFPFLGNSGPLRDRTC